MCLSCGCGHPNDDHGDSRNITLNMLNQAAVAAGTTRDKVLQNITNGVQSSSSDMGTDTNVDERSQQPAYNQAQAQQEVAGVQGQPGANSQDSNENNYGQVYNQPGTRGTTQGQESGTAWRQDTEDVNYVPPREPKQEPKRSS
jgi:hypothetical protein